MIGNLICRPLGIMPKDKQDERNSQWPVYWANLKALFFMVCNQKLMGSMSVMVKGGNVKSTQKERKKLKKKQWWNEGENTKKDGCDLPNRN